MKYFMFIVTILLFISCNEDDNGGTSPLEIKDHNFSSAEEFIENPSIQNAIDDASIPIHEGDNPPALAGDYLIDGKVKDAHETISTMIGVPIKSNFILYNQTNTGKISFSEKLNGLEVNGSGGFITGNNGAFTIWQESVQSGKEAGMPDGVTATLVLVMSGNKLNSGDLKAEGMSIVTKVQSTDAQYDKLKGIWWMWEADFDLQGAPNLLTKENIKNMDKNNLLKQILQNIFK